MKIDHETGEILETNRKQPPFLRTPYNYDMNQASDETGLSCPEKTLAVQSEYEGTDINLMLERFGQGEPMPQLARIPIQDDFTHITDFKTALDSLLAAQAVFDQLPAKVRARFGNDPQEFLEFTTDEKNRDEMRQMGLLKPQEIEPPPTRVIITGADGKPQPPPQDTTKQGGVT